MPTVLFIRDSSAVDRIDGVNIAAFTQKCKSLAGISSAAKGESLDDRLKELINKSKIMLFMKGNRSEPRCGFSKQIIAIMNENA